MDTATVMPLTRLEPFMGKLPFVRWDRYTNGEGFVNVFGWIYRTDGRADFVLLHTEEGWPGPSMWTSSAAYSREISFLLYGEADDHADCQRVEWAGLSISNVIRLEAAATLNEHTTMEPTQGRD